MLGQARTNKMILEHPFKPIFDKDSRILILGTMPSVKSREMKFYYSHPQNRFWRCLAAILQQDVPQTNEEKTRFLLSNRVALWDVLRKCEITGSDDNSIKNVVANDIGAVLCNSRIEAIFANGATAYRLYMRKCLPSTNQEIIRLPSTSPANARYTFERLCAEWGIIKGYLL